MSLGAKRKPTDKVSGGWVAYATEFLREKAIENSHPRTTRHTATRVAAETTRGSVDRYSHLIEYARILAFCQSLLIPGGVSVGIATCTGMPLT
jgi:hypothetical protein